MAVMSIRVEVVCIADDGSEERREVMTVERRELAMETLGLTLKEGKALLAGVQDFVVAQQVRQYLDQHRPCPQCGQRHTSKDTGNTGKDGIRSGAGAESALEPMLLPDRRPADVPSHEGLAAGAHHSGNAVAGDSLGVVDPVRAGGGFAEGRIAGGRCAEFRDRAQPPAGHGGTAGARAGRRAATQSVRRRGKGLGTTAFTRWPDHSRHRWRLRASRHKQGWFEVIAGKSVVAFRREEEGEVPSAKCFGFVQTYDEKPRRRLWELLKSQGMQENQQVVFMSDGGEDVRRVQEYLQPHSEHLI